MKKETTKFIITNTFKGSKTLTEILSKLILLEVNKLKESEA